MLTKMVIIVNVIPAKYLQGSTDFVTAFTRTGLNAGFHLDGRGFAGRSSACFSQLVGRLECFLLERDFLFRVTFMVRVEFIHFCQKEASPM